jgi:hypothetical protein
MGSGGHTASSGGHATHHAAARMNRDASANAESDSAAGDEAIARLNEQSLQAAQQGRAFTPGGTQQQTQQQ